MSIDCVVDSTFPKGVEVEAPSCVTLFGAIRGAPKGMAPLTYCGGPRDRIIFKQR